MSETKPRIISAFAPVELPPQLAHDPISEEDIIETLIIDTYEIDSEGNPKPVTKQIVTGKKNRKAYIESFSDDVGLEHILEKIGQGAIAEDKYSILNGMKEGQVNDLRGFEKVQNIGDMQNLADKAKYTYEHLDPDLKKNMSYAEFCTKISGQDLADYVKAKAESLLPKKKEESEENK